MTQRATSGSSGHPDLPPAPPPSATSSSAPRHSNTGAPSNTTPGNAAPPGPATGPSTSTTPQRSLHRRIIIPHNAMQRARKPTSSQIIDQLNGLISARNTIRAGRRTGNEPDVSDDEDMLTEADLAALYPSLCGTHPPTNATPTQTPNPAPPTITTQPPSTAQPSTLTQPSQPTTTQAAQTNPAPTYAFCDADAATNTQQPHYPDATHHHGQGARIYPAVVLLEQKHGPDQAGIKK
ncbi:hypothetical protein JB92DRAFT_3118391 [Gautieria morchelliformis]|nr:hypothetical protein JB92DRAFT_3118391 [Gautieria morchelliformis]